MKLHFYRACALTPFYCTFAMSVHFCCVSALLPFQCTFAVSINFCHVSALSPNQCTFTLSVHFCQFCARLPFSCTFAVWVHFYHISALLQSKWNFALSVHFCNVTTLMCSSGHLRRRKQFLQGGTGHFFGSVNGSAHNTTCSRLLSLRRHPQGLILLNFDEKPLYCSQCNWDLSISGWRNLFLL